VPAQRTVSVVIATYNRASLLPETLRSIVAQTRPPDEIILVDDGSSDQTAAVVAALGIRIRYERIENQGPRAARAHGVRMAGGDLVALVDDDDLWLPQKLAWQMEALEKSGCSWTYGDAVAFDHASGADLYRFSEVSRQHAGAVLAPLLLVNFIPSPTVLIERALLIDALQRPGAPQVRFGEDWMTWLLVAAHHPVARVDAVVARYRVHGGGAASRTQVLQRLQDCEQVLDYCQQVLDSAAQRPIRRARSFARLKAALGLGAEGQCLRGLGLGVTTLLRRPVAALEIIGTAMGTGWRMLRVKLRNLRSSAPAGR
jgi:hypothetical protein